MLGGMGHARQPQVVSIGYDTGEEYPVGGLGWTVALVPVVKAIGEVAGTAG